jgi:hypothetical protein
MLNPHWWGSCMGYHGVVVVKPSWRVYLARIWLLATQLGTSSARGWQKHDENNFGLKLNITFPTFYILVVKSPFSWFKIGFTPFFPRWTRPLSVASTRCRTAAAAAAGHEASALHFPKATSREAQYLNGDFPWENHGKMVV